MISLDLTVGVAFLLAAVILRPTPLVAGLLGATGLLWFAGDLVDPLVFAYRGTFTHALLLYPGSRLRSWPWRVVVGGAYLASSVYPLGQRGGVSVLLFLAVSVVGVAGLPRVSTVTRRSARLAVAGCVLAWGVLAAGAVARWAGAPVDGLVLSTYEFVLIAILIAITIDHRYRRSRAAIVTSLAVDLGRSARSLPDVLAEVLGDPTIVVGLVTADGITDESGKLVVPNTRSGQVLTDLYADNQRIAVLQHDAALLRDRKLLDSVAALAAVALANVRLQHEIRARILEVEASRRRLLAVGDDERDSLESALQDRVLARLERVEELLSPIAFADLCEDLDSTRATVRAFARGVYPRKLEQLGLRALRDLDPSGEQVAMDVPDKRFATAVEVAAYFLCAEALTNVAKYAHATATAISIGELDRTLVVEVVDNGVGGVDLGKGSGLRGLHDRLDVLGGVLTVSSSGHGTRVRGVIPLEPAPA
jgi:signal transduction histidine kinase